MTARRGVRADEDMQLRLELEDEKKAEEDYEQMLKQEAERMSVRDFQPKVSHVTRCYSVSCCRHAVLLKAVIVIGQFCLFTYPVMSLIVSSVNCCW